MATTPGHEAAVVEEDTGNVLSGIIALLHYGHDAFS
jgi:hypothetical protein